MSFNPVIEGLRQTLPPVFTRRALKNLTEGIISPGTVANLESLGQGPEGSYVAGKRCYEKETFLNWLEHHFRRPTTRRNTSHKDESRGKR